MGGCFIISNFEIKGSVMETAKISAILDFSVAGKLVDIRLNCANSDEQEVLEKALERHIKRDRFAWVKRFFGKR